MASLGLSVLICPVTTLLGPLLGLIALIQIRGGRHRGKPLAVLGITIGLCASGGWLAFAAWWDANARQPMLHGPRDALQAGLAGDEETFREAFVDGSPDATEFLNAFTRQWGTVRGTSQIDDANIGPAPESGQVRRIPYDVVCAMGNVRMEAELVVFGGGGPFDLVLRWRQIDFYDDEGNRTLSYPLADP